MDITSHYNPSQGLMVLSQSGSQKYPDKLDSYSAISPQIRCSDFNKNNKFCIDSCWESENIYYADYDSGYVKKIKFDGTEIAGLKLTNPYMVSVIQDSSSMNTIVTYPPQEDKGCWAVDNNGVIVKTDNQLNVLYQISGITGAKGIISDLDGGCYVAGIYLGLDSLVKLSSTATVLAFRPYSLFTPIASKFIEMSLDVSGNLWFSANDFIYSVRYQNGQIVNLLSSPLDPINDIPLVPNGEELHIGGTDVDRNSLLQDLYVTVGNSLRSYVVKYDQDGTLISYQLYANIGYPYIIKVIQGYTSDGFYILEDSSKWDKYEYGSSSSSSDSSSSSSSDSSSSISSDSSSSESSSSISSDSSSSSSTEIMTSSSSSSLGYSESSSSSSSSSTEFMTSSSSSSESLACESKYCAHGFDTYSPDANGQYEHIGSHNGYPLYQNTTTSYYLFSNICSIVSPTGNYWQIGAVTGMDGGDYVYIDGNDPDQPCPSGLDLPFWYDTADGLINEGQLYDGDCL